MINRMKAQANGRLTPCCHYATVALLLAGGGFIVLVGLWLLKVAMPRRISPVLVERER
ncbi:hypothetical protein ACIP1G_19535 [Pseudomonas sp. NPDC089392]|uniref:hypothetical protein n=1 Tax=Pseudomonas sp. NPDC089392 TaxID=3364459 RepID=UPI00382DD940